MENTNWLRQTPNKPLFADMLWSKPENKRLAGKLLIVGGHSHALSAPSAAYNASLKAGIGSVRVVLPVSAQKLLGKSFAEAEFAPVTLSGSLSQSALAPILEATEWADGVLMAGDLGHNSETAILLEKLSQKYTGQMTFSGDSLDYFVKTPNHLMNRGNSLVVANFSPLQKLLSATSQPIVLKSTMDLSQLVNAIGQFTSQNSAGIITKHADNTIVALGGKVSTTKDTQTDLDTLAAYCSVWWLQHPEKPFEALTSASYDYINS